MDLTRCLSAELRNFHPDELAAGSFLVVDNKIEMPCRLQCVPGSDVLFVMLNGAVQRPKVALPVFARWNWGRVLRGHVLSVCDPTLYLSPRLRLGWFLGREDLDPMPTLQQTADTIAALLGVCSRRIIFYGSSGGGFAALVAAAGRDDGRAIAVNPQTEVVQYIPPAPERVARVFSYGKANAEKCRAAHPKRWSALAAIAAAQQAGRNLRAVYVQNLSDVGHHQHHFLPFCEANGTPASGGLSPDGRLLTRVYDTGEGHGAEPPEIVRYMVDTAVPHLLAPASPPARN